MRHKEGTLSYPLFALGGIRGWYQIKKQIAYVPQELPAWYGNLKDNLHYSAATHSVFREKNEQEVNYILHRLGLISFLDSKWSELSGGYKLRFSLAKALVWKPKILILDEPLANLDKRAQLVFLNNIKDFSSRYNLCVILSSQHIEEVELIADKLMYLKNGKNHFFMEKNTHLRKTGERMFLKFMHLFHWRSSSKIL